MGDGKRIMVCGTRAVMQAPAGFRVVCATCGGGGGTLHPTKAAAISAAIRDSNKPCRKCGAH